MASSCTTPTWGTKSTCPRVKLAISEINKDGTMVNYKWRLTYYAAAGGAQTSVAKKYTAVFDGETVASGTYNINGKTGEHLIAEGSKVIYRTSSVKTVSFSCSMEFNLYWSGAYGGTKNASASFEMQPKTGYTVTYNANGGSGAPSSQTAWNGTFNVSTTIPYRSNYTFSHWRDDYNGIYYSGATYSISSNLTLYAVWNSANTSCTISYNANGGSGAPSSQTFSYGTTATVSNATPTKSGSTFLGWSTESGSSNYVVYERGASFTIYNSITLYAVWSNSDTSPKISNFTIERCDGSRNPNDQGQYALVKFSWSTYYQCRSVKVQYKPADSYQSPSVHSVYVYGGSYSGTENELVGGSLSADVVYEFQIVVEDVNGGSSSSQMKQLGGAIYTQDFLSGGRGVSFGKAATREYAVDSAWDVIAPNFDGKWKSNGSSHELSYSGGVLQHRSNSGSWNQIAFKSDIPSAPSAPDLSAYCFKPGDVVTFAFYGAGFVTTGKTDVCFTVPVKPMIGVSNVIAQSNSGFILRQNNRYCFGSGSTSYTYPSNYLTKIEGHTVRITAQFSADTGVINNDTIGIVWSGRLIFQ